MKFIGWDELGPILGVSRMTMSRWLKQGYFPKPLDNRLPDKVNRETGQRVKCFARLRWNKEVVDAWFEAQQRSSDERWKPSPDDDLDGDR